MIFLLDTTTFSDLMREHPQVARHLAAAAAQDRIVTCSIVRGEILFGIERLPSGSRRERLAQKASHLFAVVPCEAVPELAGGIVTLESSSIRSAGDSYWMKTIFGLRRPAFHWAPPSSAATLISAEWMP